MGHGEGAANAPADLQQHVDALARRMRITKDSRFNAARRLRARHRGSVLTISITSGCVLLLSAAQAIAPSTIESETYVLATFGVSLVTLSLSLIEVAQRYESRAEALHGSACDIHRLCDDLAIVVHGPTDQYVDSVRRISTAYHDSIRRYTDNHDPVDYHAAVQWEKSSFLGSVCVGLRQFMETHAAYIVSAGGALILTGWLIWPLVSR
jgi:hypothetical protein